jgi:catechol 2,3-dioxygenase-like lactoylglutathione lyase family enzyme
MTVELDHTIVCTVDAVAATTFYADVLGFTYAGRVGSFEVVRINDHLAFDFRTARTCSPRHFAFVMDPDTFDATFARLRESGVTYGDTQGVTYSVYFDDPDGHMLEILTYDEPASATG